MSTASFFWHDYETFGSVPRRDRPSQFAGVRTDLDLNEIGDPVMLYCQPPTDALPEPEAVLVTGILPQHAQQRGVPEHVFAAAVEAELARDGTVGVGYNSIRFDDEVTRHLLWRNLVDPYAREWCNGCGRWDLLDVVRCAWALRPGGIEWPRHTSGDAAGKPSFKLEHLTRANGLDHAAAHDALSDVRATLALARLVRRAQPRLWEFCLRLHKKDAVWAEIGSTPRPFLHLSGMYPVEQGCLAVVWPLGVHPTNRNELIVWDLAHDPSELQTLDVETARLRLFSRQSELPAGTARLPIKTIHVNKSPVVVGNLKTLGEAAGRWSLDVPTALRHAERAAAIGSSLDGLWRDLYTRPSAPDALPPDVDEDLYGGLIDNEDRRTLQRLRAMPPHELAGRRPAFNDVRLEEVLFRYRARNFEGTLDADERRRWQQHRRDRLLHGSAGGLTLAAYSDRIDALAEHADERGQALLEALVDWGEHIAPDDG